MSDVAPITSLDRQALLALDPNQLPSDPSYLLEVRDGAALLLLGKERRDVASKLRLLVKRCNQALE